MKIEHAIGETLIKIRKDFNWRAAEFAEQVPINRSYLSEIEHGKKAPSFEMLGGIAAAFDMETSEILRMIADTYDAAL